MLPVKRAAPLLWLILVACAHTTPVYETEPRTEQLGCFTLTVDRGHPAFQRAAGSGIPSQVELGADAVRDDFRRGFYVRATSDRATRNRALWPDAVRGFWRPLAGGAIELDWGTALSGVRFHLRPDGHGYRGEARTFNDVSAPSEEAAAELRPSLCRSRAATTVAGGDAAGDDVGEAEWLGEVPVYRGGR